MAAARSDYERLLSNLGIVRGEDGSLLFGLESDAASLNRDAEDAASLRSAAPSPSAARGVREESSGQPESFFSWESELELTAGEVEKQAQSFKSAVMARLLALKRRLNDSASALQSERRFIAARALALEHRSDALTEALFRERALSSTARIRMLSTLFRLHPGPDMKEAFLRWRAFLLVRKSRRAADRAAAEHRQRRLLLLAFRGWRSGARALYRERMHAELDARWADASESESQKYDSLVQGLKAELAECRSALAREEGARADVEERFRQAFLRGVSALNLEALAVLSGGSGGGGRGDSIDNGGADPPRPSGRLSASGGA